MCVCFVLVLFAWPYAHCTYIYNREPPKRYESFFHFSYAFFPQLSRSMASILDS